MTSSKEETLEQQLRGLFQQSDYIDDRGYMWCVDGFIDKEKFEALLSSQKQTFLNSIEEQSEILIENEMADNNSDDYKQGVLDLLSYIKTMRKL